MRRHFLLSALLILAGCEESSPAPARSTSSAHSACHERVFERDRFVVCDAGTGRVELIAAARDQRPPRNFSDLEASLGSRAATVAFAMNAGMMLNVARLDGAAVDVAAAGSYRDQAKAHIDELRATGSVEVATYHFDRIRAVLVRVPGSGQNSPEIGLEAWGSVTREVRDGAEEPGAEPVTEPFRLTMRMAPSDVADRYLIAGPGELWTGRP